MEADGVESHSLVWRTHPLVAPLVCPPSSPSLSLPVVAVFLQPHALVKVIHRKRGSAGIKSESVGNRKGKHASEGVAEWRGCYKASVCGVSVCVCDDTFPLRLLRTSKRHLELCTDTELFNSIPLEPSVSALRKAPTWLLSDDIWFFFLKKQMHHSVPRWQPLQSHVLKVFWVVRDLPKKKQKTKVSVFSNLLQNPCPIRDASFLSKILFWWFTG